VADDTGLDDDPALPGPASLRGLALERVSDFLAAPDPGAAPLPGRATTPACPAQLRRGERPTVGLCRRAQHLGNKTLGARLCAASAIADAAGSNAKVGGIIAHWLNGEPAPD
jgi:hypothetical protein